MQTEDKKWGNVVTHFNKHDKTPGINIKMSRLWHLNITQDKNLYDNLTLVRYYTVEMTKDAFIVFTVMWLYMISWLMLSCHNLDILNNALSVLIYWMTLNDNIYEASFMFIVSCQLSEDPFK